jgi:hypothetical protein
MASLSINQDPKLYNSIYSGNVYAFYATGGFTMDQCFNTIKLLPQAELYQYDVTQAVQIAFDVRTFNEKLNLFKDDNNEAILTSAFDIVSDSFPNDSITLTADEFVAGMKNADQVISVGTYSTMYSDYTQYVNTYFGYAGGFSSLFSSASEFNVNNGVFGANELMYLLSPSSDPSGANVKPVIGSITISNINQLLRFAVDSNVFNNRTPGTYVISNADHTSTVDVGGPVDSTNVLESANQGSNTASDTTGQGELPQTILRSNYGSADGFVAGDLFFVPAGTTVKLHLVIDAELYNPLNNTGSMNVLNLISNQDFKSKYGTTSAEYFTESSTASITNIDRVLTAPLLIKLANLSVNAVAEEHCPDCNKTLQDVVALTEMSLTKLLLKQSLSQNQLLYNIENTTDVEQSVTSLRTSYLLQLSELQTSQVSEYNTLVDDNTTLTNSITEQVDTAIKATLIGSAIVNIEAYIQALDSDISVLEQSMNSMNTVISKQAIVINRLLQLHWLQIADLSVRKANALIDIIDEEVIATITSEYDAELVTLETTQSGELDALFGQNIQDLKDIILFTDEAEKTQKMNDVIASIDTKISDYETGIINLTPI